MCGQWVAGGGGGAAGSPALLPGVVYGQLHVLRLLRAEAELRHQVQTVLRRVAVSHLRYAHQNTIRGKELQVR